MTQFTIFPKILQKDACGIKNNVVRNDKMNKDHEAATPICLIMVVVFCMLFVFTSAILAQDTRTFTTIWKFDVSDDIDYMEHSLGRSLLLQLKRINSVDSNNFGWDISVVRRPEKKNSRNLLYHSREWHGPYPTQIFAWNQKEQYFPDERILPVYGYPYEIRIRLLNIKTKGSGSETEFVSGSVEIAWRRLHKPAKFGE